MTWLKRAVIHPFLWAVYPILMLAAYNIQAVVPWTVYRPAVVSLLGAAILYCFLLLILRNAQKAGLLVTLCLLLFFSYGHILGAILNQEIWGVNVGRHGVLAPLWLVFLAAGAILILRTKRDLTGATQALNLMSVILLLLPVFQILAYRAQHAPVSVVASQGQESPLPSELAGLSPVPGGSLPDVYYIILDSYGREDTLKNNFDYNNAAFLNGLKDLGFYVANCSQSNYSVTRLSLSSSLNMEYMDSLGIKPKDAENLDELYSLIQKNKTRQTFKELGYQTVVVETGYPGTDWKDADVYLSKSQDPGRVNFLGRLTPFESMVLHTSAGLLLYKGNFKLPDQVRTFLDTQYTESRERILYAFDALETIPTLPGHKFVFVHMLAPHQPFTFGPKGEILQHQDAWSLNDDLVARDVGSFIKGYRDEVNYLNSRMLPALRQVISKSSTPPVIIVQGDHGPQGATSNDARTTILNVYYLPGGGDKMLYPSISPVNSFRVIFDTYFGAKLGLLADKAYFYTKSGAFQHTPDPGKDCQAPAQGN